MRQFVSGTVGIILTATAAVAADLPQLPPLAPPPVLWSWTGPYLGIHVGGSFGHSSFSDTAGPALYGGQVRTPSALAGGQVGFNWQPDRNWLVGVEADVSGLNGDGTNTCLAPSGFFLSANCQVRQTAMATATGRVGLVTGDAGRTLVYAKAGGAWLAEKIDIASNPLIFATSLDQGRWGWTVGAGIEKALAPAWSIKVEYDYAGFGSAAVPTPASYVQVAYPLDYQATPGGSSNVSQNVQALKVGLNVKLGADAYARWDGLENYHLRGSQSNEARPRAEIEFGARAWVSSGRFQKDLGATTDPALQNVLVSRLTYDAGAASGEVFGRIDGESNLFLKGFAGGGGLFSGKMYDEDWLIFGDTVPYSNTVSNPVKGSIAYGTVDVGYAFLRGAGFKVGGFVGYNYYEENKSAYGCTQIANQNSDCVPAVSGSVLGITENDKWHSLRVGLNGVMALGYGVELTADAAYLPYVNFKGTDNHLLRTDVANTVSPESGTGQGVQLEAVLAYQFTPAFRAGVGARYWAMWATTNAQTNIFGSDCPCQTLPARTERYGTFLEASYKFNGPK